MKTNMSKSNEIAAGMNPNPTETLQSCVVYDSGVPCCGRRRPNELLIKRPVIMPEFIATPYLLRFDAGIVSAMYRFEPHKQMAPAKPWIKRPMQIIHKLSTSISATAMNIANIA